MMEFNSIIQTRWLVIFGEQKIKKKKKVATMLCGKLVG